MIRNQNGRYMDPQFTHRMKLNLQQFAEGGDGDGAGGDNAPSGDDSGNTTEANVENGVNVEVDSKGLLAQIEQLKTEIARQKNAINDATKEAATYKRELRARQTQEEIDAANKKEADEKAAQELAELRKEVAKAKSTKSVMSKLSVDEDTAGKIAESLVGCENIENALLLIQKSWAAKEKALRLEFGKITGPGAGSGDGEDAEERAAIEMARKLGRERSGSEKSVADGLKGYLR